MGHREVHPVGCMVRVLHSPNPGTFELESGGRPRKQWRYVKICLRWWRGGSGGAGSPLEDSDREEGGKQHFGSPQHLVYAGGDV